MSDGTDGFVEEVKADKPAKHLQVDESIGRLYIVLNQLKDLRAKICGEILDEKDGRERSFVSLESHLTNAPGEIDSFIDCAREIIGDIEDRLF